MPTFRHGRNTRFYIDNDDVSNTLKSVNVNSTADTAETTAFGSTFKSYVVGMLDGKIQCGGMFDATTDAAAFNNIFGQDCVQFGSGTAVTSGWPITYCPEGYYGANSGGPPSSGLANRAWAMQCHESSYNTQGTVSEMVSIQADFVSNFGIGSGTLIQDNSFTQTTFAPWVSTNGADTLKAGGTGGGFATLHCLTYGSTGGLGYTVTITSSTTLGGAYSAVTGGVFSAFTAVGSQFLTIPATSTINQFVKISVAKDAGTTASTGIAIVVALVRR